MQSSIVALVAFSMLLALVQCDHEKETSVYEIKQGLLSGGRTYDITGKTNAPLKFSTKNELLSVGKKLTLLENGKERYTVKHAITNVMSTWTITESVGGKQLGTIQNKPKFVGSKIDANGEFGHYKIEGDFGNHSFNIMKDAHKVAMIAKKSLHVRDTYDLTVFGEADQALMVLFTIIVDEIREH